MRSSHSSDLENISASLLLKFLQISKALLPSRIPINKKAKLGFKTTPRYVKRNRTIEKTHV